VRFLPPISVKGGRLIEEPQARAPKPDAIKPAEDQAARNFRHAQTPQSASRVWGEIRALRYAATPEAVERGVCEANVCKPFANGQN
jgi:hypothetical protein